MTDKKKSEKPESTDKVEEKVKEPNRRFLNILENGNEFLNEENTIFLLPEPNAGMIFKFFMFNEGVELNLSSNGPENIFTNKGFSDDFKVTGAAKNRGNYYTLIGTGSYWRVLPNIF